jgi:hypothetical protein
MATNENSGHQANLANLSKLNSFITGYGTQYNPSKAAIKQAAMTAMYTKAKSILGTVDNAVSDNTNAIKARIKVFKPLDKIATRVGDAADASEATDEINESIHSYVRKIHGTRVSGKATDEEKAAAIAAGKPIVETTSHQRNFDSKMDNLKKLTSLLDTVEGYNPNETDLTVAGLTTYYEDLKAKNTAVVDSETPLSNARIARDTYFNQDSVGVVDITLDVKSYVKSVFGATSPQYKQVSALRFRKIYPK